MNTSTQTFRVLTGDASSPVILHVPHSSRHIPPDVRDSLLVSDAALTAELDESVDTATDLIACEAARRCEVTPWQLVNETSRIVVDPERFPDESEPMNAHGRGAIYTRCADGSPLRADEPDSGAARSLLAEVFDPYAQAMTDLTQDRLDTTGTALIIDIHSYPTRPSGFEDPALERPAICIGTDDFHTPQWLRDKAFDTFSGFGSVAENTPYAGCYVPLRFYRSDRRISAIMIEVRRDVYLDERLRERADAVGELGEAIAAVIPAAGSHASD
ncbi:N-formylglutamate amidohydrolase [Gordonia jinhuaensis]|uniref:N-formylglutamate amidohydrolase n=1 Tax=Gordonia jinhuaensis TaxID=1517702 RepID=A0A916TBI1_9ACTN|nr:N-formylglutamate amidohydrolase [Gordonia jinhuaensis]GGB37389.1 hypothetical protein GCM10011489_26530 [Gordonia jinhuaensis]